MEWSEKRLIRSVIPLLAFVLASWVVFSCDASKLGTSARRRERGTASLSRDDNYQRAQADPSSWCLDCGLKYKASEQCPSLAAMHFIKTPPFMNAQTAQKKDPTGTSVDFDPKADPFYSKEAVNAYIDENGERLPVLMIPDMLGSQLWFHNPSRSPACLTKHRYKRMWLYRSKDVSDFFSVNMGLRWSPPNKKKILEAEELEKQGKPVPIESAERGHFKDRFPAGCEADVLVEHARPGCDVYEIDPDTNKPQVSGLRALDSLIHDSDSYDGAGSSFGPMIDCMEQLGWKRGENLFGAPYDFRFGTLLADPDREGPVLNVRFYQRLKNLIEAISKYNNGKRVVLVGLGKGNTVVTFLLRMLVFKKIRGEFMDDERADGESARQHYHDWVEKYLEHWIPVGGYFKGSANWVKIATSGTARGNFKGVAGLNLARSWGIATLFPQFGWPHGTVVTVLDEKKNNVPADYNLDDLDAFFEEYAEAIPALGPIADSYNKLLNNDWTRRPVQTEDQPKTLKVTCIYSSMLQTTSKIGLKKRHGKQELTPIAELSEFAPGDGRTTALSSSSLCELWPGSKLHHVGFSRTNPEPFRAAYVRNIQTGGDTTQDVEITGEHDNLLSNPQVFLEVISAASKISPSPYSWFGASETSEDCRKANRECGNVKVSPPTIKQIEIIAETWDMVGQSGQTSLLKVRQSPSSNPKCLEAIPDAPPDEERQLRIATCTGNSEQHFTVDPDGNIVSLYNGLCLDALGVPEGHYCRLRKCEEPPGPNQVWLWDMATGELSADNKGKGEKPYVCLATDGRIRECLPSEEPDESTIGEFDTCAAASAVSKSENEKREVVRERTNAIASAIKERVAAAKVADLSPGGQSHRESAGSSTALAVSSPPTALDVSSPPTQFGSLNSGLQGVLRLNSPANTGQSAARVGLVNSAAPMRQWTDLRQQQLQLEQQSQQSQPTQSSQQASAQQQQQLPQSNTQQQLRSLEWESVEAMRLHQLAEEQRRLTEGGS